MHTRGKRAAPRARKAQLTFATRPIIGHTTALGQLRRAIEEDAIHQALIPDDTFASRIAITQWFDIRTGQRRRTVIGLRNAFEHGLLGVETKTSGRKWSREPGQTHRKLRAARGNTDGTRNRRGQKRTVVNESTSSNAFVQRQISRIRDFGRWNGEAIEYGASVHDKTQTSKRSDKRSSSPLANSSTQENHR